MYESSNWGTLRALVASHDTFDFSCNWTKGPVCRVWSGLSVGQDARGIEYIGIYFAALRRQLLSRLDSQEQRRLQRPLLEGVGFGIQVIPRTDDAAISE